MMTYRALVCPLVRGDLAGYWYAAVRFYDEAGSCRGVRVLGESGVGTWDHAAAYAVLHARSMNQQ